MASSLVYEKLDGQCAKDLEKYFTNITRTGYVKCKGFVLPEHFRNFGESIRKLEIRPHDIWVCSMPKAGELFWNIHKHYATSCSKS